MKLFIPIVVLSFCIPTANAQKPKGGTYTYRVAFAEWQGRTLGATCTIIIKGDSVTVLNNGTLSGKKGEVIDKGILIKHRSGKWVIGTKPGDKDAPDINGCGGGPRVIDFKKKIVWTC